jgi:hypothetical protein
MEPIHLPAQFLGCFSRTRHQRSMNSAAAEFRSHAHPPQHRILKPCLCLPRAGMSPRDCTSGWFRIERGKRLAQRRLNRAP